MHLRIVIKAKLICMFKTIWQIEHDGKITYFAKYEDACKSITDSFEWKVKPEFPRTNQLTGNTRIGRTCPDGSWIQLNAVPLYTGVKEIE